MKQVFSLFILTSLLISSFSALSQDEDQKRDKKRYENFKERSISKTYPASGNKLVIVNGFGDVRITTWDKNEISVNIHIEASSDNKDLAERIFNNINVTDKQTGNTISFKTDNRQDGKGNECKNCHSNMEIDYDIHMPANNTLDIENSFGDISLPDYNGTVSLDSKFGSLTTGRLQKADKLNVEFGHADIKNVSNIDAVFKFSRINIENLGGTNKIHSEFCGFLKLNLASDLTGLNLDESYSTVNLRPASGLSASYDISTSFGTVVDRANIGIKRTDEPEKYGPDSEKRYEGKSGSGSAKIDAKSSFGKIIIGEASADEMREKDKRKDKVTRV